MNKTLKIAVVTAAMATLAVAAAADVTLPRNQTLYIGGLQWGPPNSFNPVGSVPAWPNETQTQMMYETLFAYNMVSGKMEPQLALSLAAPDSKTFVVKMRSNIRWQDGQPLTSKDVVYTFELAKRQNLTYSSFWDYVSSVTANDAKTVTIKLNPAKLNPGLVKQNLTGTMILPEHLWTGFEKANKSILEFQNSAPIGSGPYKLQSANDQRIVLVRDDRYWGKSVWGSPAPKYIVHPILKSNDAANLAFQQGDIDLSQTFMPEIWKTWQDKKLPIGTYFKGAPYYLPGTIPYLSINVARKGLNNPLVRKALAYSINYPLIAQTAMSQYSVPANASLALPTGGEAKFFDKKAVAAEGWNYNPEKAVSILENQLKAKKGGDGIYVLPDGTRLGPWTVQCPFGWTDWNQSLDIVASGAKAIGIDISTKFPDAPVWSSSMQSGNYDMVMNSAPGVSPAGLWQRYHDLLDDRGTSAVGTPSFWTYNRYHNPKVYDLIDKVAALPEAKQAPLYAQLDTIFRADIPDIPLMYRPFEFYEYNQSVWTGFANSDSKTLAPQFSGAGIRSIFKLKPAK